MTDSPVLAIIGGSGLYRFPSLENSQTVEIDTPFGQPSSPIITGDLFGKNIAFLARHGVGHVFLPSEVNYRANIYALKTLGVPRIVSISACGSLREDFKPGEIVIPDQIVDLTRSRSRTFFGDGIVAHIGAADPFCKNLSSQLIQAVRSTRAITHKGGTYITIEGPRFSTKAESNLYREWGMSVIGMTACPEVFLAREAEICYATMAHVTDYDVWHSSEKPVTVDMVIETLNHNTGIAQDAVIELVKNLPENRDCECDQNLKDAIMTQRDKIDPDVKKKLAPIIKKYI
jgi:5'-methylthioadenosine phosphorylase